MGTSKMKQIISEKFKYIVIVGFICAIIASGYKFCFTPAVSYEGNFKYTRIIRIENSKDVSNSHYEFNYAGVLNTDGSYVAFLTAAERVYDFSKINSSWYRLSQQEKIKWLRNLTKYNNYHNDTYEIMFNLPSNSIADLPYLNKNFNGLMDMFVMHGNQLIAKIKPNAVIGTVSETVLLPKEIVNNKKSIALKYCAYGFVAGIFLSMAVFIGIPLFKNIQD